MLGDILKVIAKEEGIDLSDVDQRTDLVSYVNRAGKILHQTTDLYLFKREMIIVPQLNSAVASLPWYVAEVYYIRDNELQHSMERELWRPRYANRSWPTDRTTARFIGESPVTTDTYDAGPVYVIIPEAQAVAVKVKITGSTASMFSYTETVTIPAGSLKVLSTASFGEIRSITRGNDERFDVNIWDLAESTLLAYIPSSRRYSNYKKMQWTESTFTHSEAPIWEILFKHAFFEMVEDEDTYVGTHELDEALISLAKALRITDPSREKERIQYHRVGQAQVDKIDARYVDKTDSSQFVFSQSAIQQMHENPEAYLMSNTRL